MNSIATPEVASIGTEGGKAGHPPQSLWLGYAPSGGRVTLRFDELRGKLLIAGHSADRVASLMALSCRQAGLRCVVLDLDGNISSSVSGYFETYDFSCFLYDAFQVEEDDQARSAQLIAAAYTSALDLSQEEETIIGAAMQALSMTESSASPHVLYQAIAKVEGFRGFYIDKLQGRIAAVKFLEGTENASLRSVLPLSGSLISFKSARYPQSAELAAAVFISRLLSFRSSSDALPDVLIINDAHKIFRSGAKSMSRLLSELLDSSMSIVLVSDRYHALTGPLQGSFPVRILTSEVWNEGFESRWKASSHERILPNACVLTDHHYGHARVFIPRGFETKTVEPRRGPGVREELKPPDNALTRLILNDVMGFEAPSRTSIVEFLSGEYGEENVKRELDRLHSQGMIALDSSQDKSVGHPMLLYSITQKGRELLEVMGE